MDSKLKGRPTYDCPICGKVFPSALDKEEHMKLDHHVGMQTQA